MIVIAEPACIGFEHAPFNAAMVEIAVILAHGSEIVFYGDHSHMAAVKQVLGDRIPKNISWRTIDPPQRRLRDFAKRFLLEFLLFSKILKASRSCDLLIVTSALETSLPALKAQCILSRFKPRINVIFHAGLPQFLYSKKRRTMLSVAIPENMTYIVLGEHIKAAVIKKIPELSKKMHGIEHPYIFDNSRTNNDPPNSLPVFGFIGLASKAKGFDKFLEIIENHNKKNMPTDSRRFKLVGKVADDCVDNFEKFIRSKSSTHLDYPVGREKLPLEVYRNEVNSVDYFVMPYDKKFYEFIGSGASMDALYFCKPIIALKSTYFSYLFNLCGDIGFICDDLNEMESIMSDLANSNDHGRYRRQSSNLTAARAKFSPMAVSKEIATININPQC